MQSQQNEIFKKIAKLISIIFVLLFPLVFSSAFSNLFDVPKKVLLFTTALLLISVWVIKDFIQKEAKLAITPYTLPLVALCLISLASALLAKSQFFTNLYTKTGIILAFTIIFLSLTTLTNSKLKSLLYSLIGTSFILSWISIFAYLEVLPKIVSWQTSKAFSLLGGPLSPISFLAVILPVTLAIALKSKDVLLKTLLFVTSAIQAVALIFLISLILPGQPFTPALLPFSAGWSIAVDMLKNAKTALLGIGPDNFLAAYTRFKPISLNLNEKLWNVRFANSSNEILNLTTTTGLLGLLSFIWLTINILKTIIKNSNQVSSEIKLGLGLTLLLHLVIPANLAVWLLTFTFLIIASQCYPKKIISLKGNFGPNLINLILAGITLIGFYSLLNFIKADLAFTKSLKAASQNRGTETYNLQIEAIKLNPYEIRYRITYANTNLALANSLAAKEDLTDEDRKNITQLVGQSIREAKAAVALNPQNVIAWENLAGVYRNLINFAQGSNRWATSSYIEAIRLDPLNPQLRLDLGGLFYALGNYDNALDQFKRAVDFKPDYSNAYYNLSAAYKQKEDNLNAFLAMQKALNLIDKDSQDFDKVSLELSQLRKLLPEEVQTATASAKKPGQLQAPQPLPSPKPAGEVKFNPQEQERLAPEVEPTPIPSPIPTPLE